MSNIEHIGDGVYVSFDGYQIALRVNHHLNEPVVYLDPEVMKRLNEFYLRKKAENENSSRKDR